MRQLFDSSCVSGVQGIDQKLMTLLSESSALVTKQGHTQKLETDKLEQVQRIVDAVEAAGERLTGTTDEGDSDE